ncbi:MAG TPA: hypothetical protein VJ697_08770 [Nitrososphaeraceae archaeon]|nr:hypothetical protein [Nitrososphaeraceae archaeon]
MSVRTEYKDLVHIIYAKGKSLSAFIIYGTIIQNSIQHFWLWIATEPVHRIILSFIFQMKETCC